MKVLIVTYYRYPNGDAGSVRQHSLAKLYEKIGYDVTIVGMGYSGLNEILTHNGVKYTSFRHSEYSKLSKIKNFLFYTSKLKNLLLSSKDGFDVIHIANTNFNILLYLKCFASTRNISLVHDSVEWYSAKQFKLRFISPSYVFKHIANKYLINESFKVISISKYLQLHFSRKGIKTIRIPIVFDITEMSMNYSVNEKLVITYAGSPGKKDYIEIMLKGISELDLYCLDQIEFRIIGIDENTIKKMCRRYSINYLKIKDSLRVYGKVTRNSVLENLGSSDFCVMLRDANARYAKAGFPTKIVEGLICGTPVITNISSDLNEYLIDRFNCILVERCDSISFSQAIRQALSLNKYTLNEMKKNAYDTAISHFDIDLYKNELEFLLNEEKCNTDNKGD